MVSWQYRCKSCGEVHAAPLRPGGTTYLRCVATHEWAWYEPASFVAPGGSASSARLTTRGGSRVAGGARRSIGGARRARAGVRAQGSSPARGSRRTAARKTTRASKKRR